MIRAILFAALTVVAGLITTAEASPIRGLAVGDVDVDGDRQSEHFSAAFLIKADGTARGSATLTDGRIVIKIRFLEALVEINRDARQIDIEFFAVVRQTMPGRAPIQDLMVGSVSTTDNPECLIWDIRDSCPSIDHSRCPASSSTSAIEHGVLCGRQAIKH